MHALQNDSRLAHFAAWYSEVLRDLDEPSLCGKGFESVPEVVIRVSHFPSFGAAKIARAWKHGNHFHLVRKLSSGMAGYPPVELAAIHERPMHRREFDEFEAWIADPDLWLPLPWYTIDAKGDEYVTYDGDSWLAEYRTPDSLEASACHTPLNQVWLSLAQWTTEWFKVFET